MCYYCNQIEDNFRFNYINAKLCEVCDQIVDVEDSIEGAKIELEIAKRMDDIEGAKVIKRDLFKLKDMLQELEEKESVLEDMLDEEFIKVLLVLTEPGRTLQKVMCY